MRIFKYKLDIADFQFVLMPAGAEILTVQVQNESPCIWAIVDPSQKFIVSRGIRIYGTGHDIQHSSGKYIGTFQMGGGSLVFHVFEEF